VKNGKKIGLVDAEMIVFQLKNKKNARKCLAKLSV